MKIIDIDTSFNEEILNYKGVCIVDFWAIWCGPCKMLSPIFEEISNEYDNIKFCKLNVDYDKNNICKKYGVMSIPTIIIFKNGKEIKRNVGFINKEQLKTFLES